MKLPRLIQRCRLHEGKLTFDDMGVSNFEWAPQNSLRRIFKKEIAYVETTITYGQGTVWVGMVASEGFNFQTYRGYLQRIAQEEGMRFLSAPRFKDEIEYKWGLQIANPNQPRVNVWLDIENDVLWTIESLGLATAIKAMRERSLRRPTASIS